MGDSWRRSPSPHARPPYFIDHEGRIGGRRLDLAVVVTTDSGQPQKQQQRSVHSLLALDQDERRRLPFTSGGVKNLPHPTYFLLFGHHMFCFSSVGSTFQSAEDVWRRSQLGGGKQLLKPESSNPPMLTTPQIPQWWPLPAIGPKK